MRYDFIQHMTSGDVYAAHLDDRGDVAALCGPLHYRDLCPDRLPDYDYSDEDAAWANGQPFRLLSTVEVLQRAHRD